MEDHVKRAVRRVLDERGLPVREADESSGVQK